MRYWLKYLVSFGALSILLVSNRRRRRYSSDSDDSYQEPRNTNRRIESTENQVNEYEDVQMLLRTFAEERKYQRYSDSRPVPQPIFATAEYNQLLSEQPTEEQELLAKLCIDIKENLYQAYENESRANFHHFVVAEKLVTVKERVGVDRFQRMIRDDFSISKKTFARYRLYYKLVSKFPRFKHCTLTFNMLKDRIPRILKYFDSQECADIPLTDKCSKYFWLTEPTTYHNFNTVKGINYNHDEQEINVSDTDTDSDDEDTLMTSTEFQKSCLSLHSFAI